MCLGRLVSHGGANPSSPSHAFDPQGFHDTGDLVSADLVAGTPSGLPQLVGPHTPDSSPSTASTRSASSPHLAAPEPRAIAYSPHSTSTGPPATCHRWARPRTCHDVRPRSPLSLLWAVELRREESRSPLQDLVRPTQLFDFLHELSDPSSIRAGHPSTGPVVDVSLVHSVPNRLHPILQLLSDPLHRSVTLTSLGPQLADQPHSLPILRIRIPTSRRFPSVLSLPMIPSSFPKVRGL